VVEYELPSDDGLHSSSQPSPLVDVRAHDGQAPY
jgi:hypothetical protein